MNSRCIFFALTASSISLATLAAPAVANACSAPPPCASPLFSPQQSATYPAGSVAVPLRSADVTGVELRDQTGALIPFSAKEVNRRYFLVPDSPLVPYSSYSIHYDSRCDRSPDAGAPRPAVYQFSTRDPAPYPTTAGTLRIFERGTNYPGGSLEASFVRVKLDMAEAQLPYHSASSFVFAVDGHTMLDSTRFNNPTVFTVLADCKRAAGEWHPDTCGTNDYVPPGKHTVTMTTFVDGAPSSPPPLSIEVEVDCGATTPDAGPLPDGGANPGPVPPAAQPDGAAGGCSLSDRGVGGSDGTRAGLAALGALAGVLAARARRRASV